MIAAPTAQNCVAWMGQMLLVASAGAVLPIAFRMRHPKTQLAYYHLVLVLCLLLPVLVPSSGTLALKPRSADASIGLALGTLTAGGHETATRGEYRPENAAAARSTHGAAALAAVPWMRLVLWAAALGVAVKLLWIVFGIWRIRRYRTEATPLYPVPEAVRAALALTNANAVACISPKVAGPVMLWDAESGDFIAGILSGAQ